MLDSMQDTIPSESGIYRIQIGPRTFYWGQAQDLRARAASHRSQLKHGRHGNPVLSAAYNKYGPEDMKFRVVLLCASDDLDFYEQRLLDRDAGRRDCANIAMTAGAPMRGRKHSEDTLAVLRARVCSPETRAKMSAASIGRKKTREHADNISKGLTGLRRDSMHAIRLRVSKTTPVLVSFDDGTVGLYMSTAEFCAYTGHSASNAKRWLRGASQTYKKHNIASIERVDKS